MFDNIFIIISKGKNNSYARDLSNERRNWVRMCHGVKSKCQLKCLIYGRVMLLIGASIFYRYTLHATQIDWNIMGYGATGDLWTPSSWGRARGKNFTLYIIDYKIRFFCLIKCMRRTIEKRWVMCETQERIKSLPHWFRYEFEHSQNNMLAFVPIWVLNKNLYEIFSIITC